MLFIIVYLHYLSICPTFTQNVSTEFQRKETEVITLQAHLEELREDIKESRVYVDEMQGKGVKKNWVWTDRQTISFIYR